MVCHFFSNLEFKKNLNGQLWLVYPKEIYSGHVDFQSGWFRPYSQEEYWYDTMMGGSGDFCLHSPYLYLGILQDLDF